MDRSLHNVVSAVLFLLLFVFKDHSKKERTCKFGSAHSLVDAPCWLGTELGVGGLETCDGWFQLLRDLESHTVVSDFSLHKHLLGADYTCRFLGCSLRDVDTVGPKHLHLQPDPWVILICLYFEGAQMGLKSEKIKWKTGNPPGPGSLHRHVSQEVSDLKQTFISGSRCELGTKS